jgi:hypothetical protein
MSRYEPSRVAVRLKADTTDGRPDTCGVRLQPDIPNIRAPAPVVPGFPANGGTRPVTGTAPNDQHPMTNDQ